MADVRQHHRCRAAGNARRGVVFGHPEALVACLLGHHRQRARLAQGGGGIAAFADGDEIEDGQRIMAAMVSAGTFSSCAR
jgi:hypothetical protein